MFVTAVMNIAGIEAEVAAVERACVQIQGCGESFIGNNRHVEEHFRPSFRPGCQVRKSHYSADFITRLPDFSNTCIPGNESIPDPDKPCTGY
jgi:hypothetical protein